MARPAAGCSTFECCARHRRSPCNIGSRTVSPSVTLAQLCTWSDEGKQSVRATALHATWQQRNASAGPALQFGVLHGRSLARISHAFGGKAPIWGFDSFVGLPEESPGKLRPAGWAAGALAAVPGASNRGNAATWLPPQTVIQAIINATRRRIPGEEVQLVAGMYNKSLTAPLARSILRRHGTAAYIDIDCDLYVSTFTALDWVFTHGLARVGTVLGFDDWWNVPCASSDMQRDGAHIATVGGEPEALLQAASKHSVWVECICGACSAADAADGRGWRTYFIVRSLAAAHPPEPNFGLAPHDARAFLRKSNRCRDAWAQARRGEVVRGTMS
jgi:hypothetical protein